MSAKKWIRVVSVFSIISILLTGLVNFIVDPLWTFNHSHAFNNMQNAFNERQQKTNDIYFNGLHNFDGILFGSSRTTYINQNDFNNMRIYSYAFNGMYPFEYEEYLNFAKKVKGKDFKYIIIGADFYNSMKQRIKRYENPDYYINNTTSLFYRYKMLISFDAFRKSLSNVKNSLKGKSSIYYTRDNIKYRPKVSEKERLERYKRELKIHTWKFSGSNYQTNKEYINILKRLRYDNPNTKIIIFTSPMTADLLTSIIVNANKFIEFERWLKELVEVFGEIYHFMTINSITTDLQNYPDDSHYYPYVGKLLANKISNKENKEIPQDFGLVLNENNIDEYLTVFREQIKNYYLNKTLEANK